MACVLLGCGSKKTRRHEYLDSGSLCLRAGGDRLHAEVRLLECLSSSCNEQLNAVCSISQKGAAINVTSRMLLGPNGADTCATDCGSWIGRCELPLPAAGEYTLSFGAAHTSLRLPLVMDTELMPDGSTHGCLPSEL
jgi:hypothetical protein